MTAYAIVDIEIYDIEQYLDYQRAVKPLLEAAGGRYLARGGEFAVIEGDYEPQRLLLVEFPSLKSMQDFYRSDTYRALEAQRKACSTARIIGVEGCASVFQRSPADAPQSESSLLHSP